MVFYDYVGGMEPNTSVARLVGALYSNTDLFGEPSTQPSVRAEPAQGGGANQGFLPGMIGPMGMPMGMGGMGGGIGPNHATIGGKQPVPRLVFSLCIQN